VTDRPEVRRVRHETKRRSLTVREVQHLTPKMIRVSLEGAELAGFVSMGFDDHVKVILPPPGSDELVLPTMGPDGPIFPEGAPKPEMRDYTPRRYDAAAGVLDIDFAIHDAGPATTWARAPGQDRPWGSAGHAARSSSQLSSTGTCSLETRLRYQPSGGDWKSCRAIHAHWSWQRSTDPPRSRNSPARRLSKLSGYIGKPPPRETPRYFSKGCEP
jgi:hypothetical protein